MRHSTFSFVYSDALKLIQHREHIQDLGLAFELLGLQVDPADWLTRDVPEFELSHELDSALEGEIDAVDEFDEFDEFAELDEYWDKDGDMDDWPDEEDFEGHRDKLTDRRVSRTDPRTFYAESFKRSMVAYLLTADDRTNDENAGAPVPGSVPIESRVQRIQSELSVPDAEAWRIARDISDSAPRAHRPGKIDVRACVNLIAQRRPIEVLPRRKANRASRDASILVDSRLFRGTFRADVDQLRAALHSMGIQTQKRPQQITRHFSKWYVRGHANAPALPFAVDSQIKWYVFITGGEQATLDNLGDARTLTDQLLESSRVTVVWIGDSLPTLVGEEARKWIAFRS